MSCRRLEEIDLIAFLEDGAAEAFAEFREHYPTCRECSAGVRAFSDLHSDLRGEGAEAVHPSPETLEAYERRALAEPVQANTERHLATCARCRDELRALARFSPAPAQRAAPLPRDERDGFHGFLDALTRLATRPAFAVVLVGLLLLPLIYRARPGLHPEAVVVEDAAPTEMLSQAPLDPEGEIAARERALGSADDRFDEARPRPRSSAKQAAPEPPPLVESAESAGRTPPKSVVADEVLRVPAEARREIAAEFDAKAKRSAPAEARPPATNAVAQKAEPVVEMEAMDAPTLADGDEAAATASPSAGSAPSAGSEILEGHRWIPTLRLKPGARATATKKDVAHGVFLDIPLPLRVVDGEARVRVIPDPGFRADLSRDSATSARQAAAPDLAPPIERRVAVEEGQRALLIQLPGDSLVAGRYRVELEIMNEGEIAGRGRFRVEVLEE